MIARVLTMRCLIALGMQDMVCRGFGDFGFRLAVLSLCTAVLLML